ncbi:hypothetical protein M0C34_05265 [Agarivorans sp. TSD2052]|uniref:hypothetical protein n=1 Tax=Agarivorans sp. TSD2052 TaxID=2937286 RepID=UPI00200F1161|nr:hypothetical protein [Agarivorans sp. TSD2052]UPW19692.1 hypothetical protein M0C34_05265 [Agarivorans sp. TSD2052]
MKTSVLLGFFVLGLSACAATGPTVEEVAASYQTELNAPHKETVRQKIVDSCSLVRYKDSDLEGGCYLSSDVIVYEFRLTDNRMEWNPQAAATITKMVLEEVCEDDEEALKYGFALLVNLEGKNGFIGKLKSFKDCQNI